MADTSNKRKAKVLDSDSDDARDCAYINDASKRMKKATATAGVPNTPTTRRKDRVPRQVFRFMDLPQELRDMVYHELLRHSSSLILPQRSHERIKVLYGKLPSYETIGLPNWLLTNKAILSQGLAQLLRNSSWHWWATWNQSSVEEPQSPLAGLSAASNFSMTGIPLFQYANNVPSVKGKTMKLHDLVIPASRVGKILSACTPKLKTLTLALEFDLRGLVPSRDWDLIWTLDLAFLDTTNLQLDSLTICLHVSGYNYSVHAVKVSKWQNAVRTEVTRVGELLVGVGGNTSLNTVTRKFTPGYEGDKKGGWDQTLLAEFTYSKVK
jgi:hypothetical protein